MADSRQLIALSKNEFAPPGQLRHSTFCGVCPATMTYKILLSVILMLMVSPAMIAQNSKADVCVVGLMDYSGKDPERQEFVLSRRFGTFHPTVGEEERTTRSYRLPGTKLFVVASVFFTDESIQVPEHYDSISLQVSVSTKRKFDPIHSLANAAAEAIYRKPYAARVYALFKVRGRPKLIVLECRQNEIE